MSSGAVVFLLLALGGAAALAGGIVFYRGSTTAGKRATGAALAALGVAMWLVLAFVIPASASTS